MKTKKTRIKEIQQRGLKILLEVDEICCKYNIKYFLDSGTLLGAVRHKGFIPWDDDVDIAMPRKAYELFLEIVKKNIDKQYFVQNNESDPEFPFAFTKIIDTNSIIPVEKRNKYRTGLCLDVFPIDNASDNKFRHKINLFKIKIIQGLTKNKVKVDLSDYENLMHKLLIIFASLLGRLFSAETLMKKQRKIAISQNHKTTSNKCIYCYPYDALDLLFPSEIFAEIEMLEFEGKSFPVPKEWDKALTIRYGDYMVLPPKEERVPIHDFEHLDFIDD